MKFMKLGSKPDSFHTDGNSIRYVLSDLATDIVVNVGEVTFYLHKFPLLSKSNLFQKLLMNGNAENTNEVQMFDFPGGAKAFEMCAKFCYGMAVTLNAYNVVAARCAAEYLEMTEDVERGNLIFKIEVFLNSSLFRSWKDSIIVLQTVKSLLPWSEDLNVIGRCIDSIASKTSVDPSIVDWSYTYNRKCAVAYHKVENEVGFRQKMQYVVPKDWWVEDICEVEVDLYKRAMVAVKSKGRMSANVIGEALKAYAMRWLPVSIGNPDSDDDARRYRPVVEAIIWLLPSEKCSSPCSFLLTLLKFSVLAGIGDASQEHLVKRIALQLDKASVNDLLIPARLPDTTVYDVGLVRSIVNWFTIQDWNLEGPNHVKRNENIADNLILGSASLLNVGKLVDGYLAEIAHDPNLSLTSFIDLSESIPESARPVHDGLYRAVDIYLKEHPGLTKAERKKICSLLDIKKLSMEACMHAAQNEWLPLRMVVQVLHFEQMRAAKGGLNSASNGLAVNVSCDSSRSVTNNTEEYWDGTMEEYKSLNKEMAGMIIGEEDNNYWKNGEKKVMMCKKSRRGGYLLPSRSRRIFDKLWASKGGGGQGESMMMMISETSPQGPTSMNLLLGKEGKSIGSSRQGRYSIS